MIKRQQKVSYKANEYFAAAVPLLRITNRYLSEICRINIGDIVNIEYSEGTLIIRKTT